MQTLDFDVNLGSSKTGLTLQAQLVDQTGTNVGSAITSGFAEIGGGSYLWNCNTIPDDFRGGVIFQKTDETFLAFTSINPNEISPSGLDQIQVESGVNLTQALAVISAALGGLISGSGTNLITIKAINNPSVTRITATVSNTGDRTAITLNLP